MYSALYKALSITLLERDIGNFIVSNRPFGRSSIFKTSNFTSWGLFQILVDGYHSCFADSGQQAFIPRTIQEFLEEKGSLSWGDDGLSSQNIYWHIGHEAETGKGGPQASFKLRTTFLFYWVDRHTPWMKTSAGIPPGCPGSLAHLSSVPNACWGPNWFEKEENWGGSGLQKALPIEWGPSLYSRHMWDFTTFWAVLTHTNNKASPCTKGHFQHAHWKRTVREGRRRSFRDYQFCTTLDMPIWNKQPGGVREEAVSLLTLLPLTPISSRAFWKRFSFWKRFVLLRRISLPLIVLQALWKRPCYTQQSHLFSCFESMTVWGMCRQADVS